MRYFEIILKLAFVVSAGILMYTKTIPSAWFCTFLIVSLILGVTLIFNKQASYNFPQSKRDLIIRRIEGGLLVVFVLVSYVVVYNT